MSEFTLVVVDTVGIQPYIFGSNRLRENVGASHLVHMATGGWLFAEPERLLPRRHNIEQGALLESLHIETEEIDAEVIYAGGGNTAILFRIPDDATAFARKLSERVLCEAPGLDVVLVQQSFKWQQSLAQTLKDAFKRLGRQKAEREFDQPLLGLGVTAACRSTGLVANDEAQEPGEAGYIPLSSSAYAKWQQNEPAKWRLRNELLQVKDKKVSTAADFDFPDQFDQLGRTSGNQSYIAVVHADGNSMGERFDALGDTYCKWSGDGNREYIKKLRELSNTVNQIGQDALAAVVRKVWEWNETVIDEKPLLEPFVDDQGQKYLSIRPVVFGGDDVTFVCDGRIGLWAAQIFLEHFSQRMIEDEKGKKQPVRAAAGVAIVKVHYPFARAYNLSEQLSKRAKTEFGRQQNALDWHIAQSGLFGTLAEMRAREYQEQDDDEGKVVQSLLMRPMAVGATTESWRTWKNFVKLSHTLRNREQWSRNKVLDLREALTIGETAVRRFVANYRRDLPEMDGLSSKLYRQTGWYDDNAKRCVYFDAIEMIDQQLPELPTGTVQKETST